MAIPNWAVEALMRGVGSVVDKVPPEKLDQIKQRAGSWLDELPVTAARGVNAVFRSARTGKEMIDRWARRHTSLVTPVMNASGTLADARLQGVPVGEAAIDLAVEALCSPPLDTPQANERLQRRLARCAGGGEWSILVASSIDAACLAVGMSRRNHPVFIHRSQALRLPSGTPMPDAFMPGFGLVDARTQVHEVGSVDGFTPADLEGITGEAILVAVDNGDPQPLWFANARREASIGVVVMPMCGGITQPRGDSTTGLPAISPPLRFAGDYLAAKDGVDLVIASGDGALGGPSCGLIIGRRAVVDSIAATPIWRSLQAKIVTTAMMTQTLEHLAGGEAVSGSPGISPVRAMIETGEENLRSRAERLAIRISADESIRTCQVTAHPAKLAPHGPWEIASRQLKLQHHGKSAQAWADQLASSVPAVLSRIDHNTVGDQDFLVIDLRWIQPSDDVALAAALLGQIAGDVSEGTGPAVDVNDEE
jgi:L-seryl-tRNA(Ser) seleniumtransferase